MLQCVKQIAGLEYQLVTCLPTPTQGQRKSSLKDMIFRNKCEGTMVYLVQPEASLKPR